MPKHRPPNARILVPFFKFFSVGKITFFRAIFCQTIMLSHFLYYYMIYFCYILIRLCTRLEKFLRNGHKKYVQKSKPRNTFQQIRRALGNLRNFFGAHCMTSYMRWQYCNIYICTIWSREKMTNVCARLLRISLNCDI